jgi:hypothetical protein
MAWWAALTVAFAIAVTGCSEVGKCKQGEKGCIGGACSASDPCSFDLTCVPGAGLCGKPAGNDKVDFGSCMLGEAGCFGGGCKDGSCAAGFKCMNNVCMPSTGGNVGDGDGDGDADAGGPTCTDTCMETDPDAVCTTDKGTCVNFCEVPDVLPGTLAEPRPSPTCSAIKPDDPALTFDELCKRRCQFDCRNRGWFCGSGDKCEPGACDKPEVLVACHTECDTESDPLKCVLGACEENMRKGCAETTCTGGAPNCTGVKCSNNCVFSNGMSANGDGYCDDGDTFHTDPIAGELTYTDSNICQWGTDCSDCGPRMGEDNSRNLPMGALCNYNSACAGHKRNGNQPDLETNRAWCLELTAVQQKLLRCLPDASGKNETCPDGYSQITLENPPGTPIVIDGITAKACVPHCSMIE